MNFKCETNWECYKTTLYTDHFFFFSQILFYDTEYFRLNAYEFEM